MIVADTVFAEARVDIHYADDADALGHVTRKLAETVIREGEAIGAFIGPNSVYFRRGVVEYSSGTFPLAGYWCPDPALGVEFRGGPNDGKVIGLTREKDGRPPARVVLPRELTAPEFTATTVPRPTQHGHYERAGIDSAADRWVYAYVKTT